ncbi:hypothetical protein [Klebsiella michiganensis]|uniref:hypothetical protein n=1 Tax=Klebsiella michiganensis TaxID=1134687 RepID=UPI00255B354E|nr:hypothetical protein [Klebsiella michiganensis]MDL4446314.1 hypothetical protein [Klebsiella michiganensis]MDL4490890.1 hypothetical protein [Klebsiella michiganensis]MDL4659633.1 hypothetical protein [Klebsiella michiganensis]
MGQIYRSDSLRLTGAGSSQDKTIPLVGEPGSDAMFAFQNAATLYFPGATVQASILFYGGVVDGTEVIYKSTSQPEAGTWEIRGCVRSESEDARSLVTATRIDVVPTALRATPQLHSLVRNPSYSSEDGSRVDCELFIKGKWHPFTAAQDDVTWWGRDIFSAAKSGKLGSVAAYVAPEDESITVVSKTPPVSVEYHNSVVAEVEKLREIVREEEELKAYLSEDLRASRAALKRALSDCDEHLKRCEEYLKSNDLLSNECRDLQSSLNEQLDRNSLMQGEISRLKVEIDSRISTSEAMRKSCQRWVEKYFKLDDRLVCTQRALRRAVMALKLTAVAAAAIVIVNIAYIAQFLN